MTLPDLVVIPGGEHAGDCWDLTVADLDAAGRDEIEMLGHSTIGVAAPGAVAEQNFQRACTAAPCEVDHVVPIEACRRHVMVNNPKQSAQILLQRCRTHG